jgi:zinc and cadmium transporter
MISVAIADLLPEAFAQAGKAGALAALAGYLLVHLTQHVLARHFHFGEETHEVSHAVSISALAGLMLHTFVDGVAIASGFEVSATLGGFVFVAILLHKFPEGLAITSLFLAAGSTRGRALGAAALLGLATLCGAVLAELVPVVARWGLPVAGGVTLYVGASNLVPELQRGGKRKHALEFSAGVALYFIARTLVPH